MSRFRQMQTFEAVARAGSLAGAARQLQQSPATIMRTIAALEARLHNTLLLRSPRGVALSPAGELFAQSCRQIIEQTEEAERSAAGVHASPDGQLTVSLPLLMDLQVFTPIALAYLEAFADVQLAIHTRDGVPRLLKEGIDVALVMGALPSSSEFAMSLGQVQPLICAAPGYLSRYGRPQVPEDLKAHRAVVSTAATFDTHWQFPSGPSTRLVKPAQVLTCSTQRGAIRAATLGLGLVRCMSYEAHDELQRGALQPVLTDFALPGVPTHLIYRHGRRAEARVRSFIDFVTPLLRSHPAFTA